MGLVRIRVMTHRYIFAVHDNNNAAETLGGMDLVDDREAFDFGKLVIRDLMHCNATPYAGWALNITMAKRIVGSLPFKPIAVSKKGPRLRPGLISRRLASFG
jgi:hypothetical protein